MRYLLSLGLIFVLFACQEDTAKKKTATTTKVVSKLFEQIPSTSSGITFSNTLKEDVGTLENLFDFDYFYNGAGVGIADINNDGLQDIFFAGNQSPNKLYLNKGNLTFEDISETAGINQGKQWANGVTFADINSDGLLDIYVSQGGPKQAPDRKNLLYINLGNNRFRESAAQYNLADTGISTQSVFFDYDNDGDLDCVVSNENELYGLDPKRFFASMKIKENLEKSSVQLYENKGNSYVKVTKQAGLLKAAFGLGITVSDVNNDGLLDIYIANDYYVPDALYINNGDRTFTDRIKEYTKQVSFFGMGVDIADINNDRLQDIFVLDMAASDHIRSKTLMASMDESRFDLLTKDLGFQHQYMFNSLQLNVGNNSFTNVVQQSKMAKTDWSWAGLLVDLDNDGYRDVYVTNGYRKYALDNDLQNQVRETQRVFGGNVPKDAKQKLYDAMPTEKLSNVAFKNQGDLSFKQVGYQWGLSVPSYSNGGAYADLDNDGDLDLIVNNIDDEALVFKNTSVDQKLGNYLRIQLLGKTSEPFAKVTINYGGKTQVYESKRAKGYLSATEDIVHFGLGEYTTIDEVVVSWMSGKQTRYTNVDANTTLVSEEVKAQEKATPVFENYYDNTKYAFAKANSSLGINYRHSENEFNDFEKEVLLPYKQSTLGPFMSKGDANGDGLKDMYIGGASGQKGKLYIQGNTGFSGVELPKLQKDQEDMESLFVDVDSDGDQDLIVLSGGTEFKENSKAYQNRLYRNNGSGVYALEALDKGLYNSKTITALDFDKDGDQDLVIGNRIKPQHYPEYQSSQLLENRNGIFEDVTQEKASDLINFGMVNKVITTDFNNDGREDFIAVGEWTEIGFFQNDEGGFTNVSGAMGMDKEKGWWFTIKETDLNKDGLPDYVIGNIGANTKYKASTSKPFKVFASDFDDNGSFDLVLSNDYNGVYVPARGKECSTQQMPFISEKFETYEAFANASLEDIYGENLKEAYTAEVSTFASKILLNKGNGTFSISELPGFAQSAPILSIVVEDVNKDGYEDLIAVGNIFETEVETPRYDGGNGTLLLSNQKDNYIVQTPAESGLFIEGNAKNIISIKHEQLAKDILIGGVNDAPVQVFTLQD